MEPTARQQAAGCGILLLMAAIVVLICFAIVGVEHTILYATGVFLCLALIFIFPKLCITLIVLFVLLAIIGHLVE